MTGFLSLITYSPLIGVAVILIMKAFGKADDASRRGARAQAWDAPRHHPTTRRGNDAPARGRGR